MKRIEANDLVAIRDEGVVEQCKEGNYSRAFEYFTKAAEFGDAIAQFQLSLMYKGRDIEKTIEKKTYHLKRLLLGGMLEQDTFLDVRNGTITVTAILRRQ